MLNLVFHFHIISPDLPRPHRCPLCGQGFSSPPTLSAHLRRAHPSCPPPATDAAASEFTFSCDECEARFPSYARLYDHRLRHLPPGDPRRPHCRECNKDFSNRSSLRHHRIAFHKV